MKRGKQEMTKSQQAVAAEQKEVRELTSILLSNGYNVDPRARRVDINSLRWLESGRKNLQLLFGC